MNATKDSINLPSKAGLIPVFPPALSSSPRCISCHGIMTLFSAGESGTNKAVNQRASSGELHLLFSLHPRDCLLLICGDQIGGAKTGNDQHPT